MSIIGSLTKSSSSVQAQLDKVQKKAQRGVEELTKVPPGWAPSPKAADLGKGDSFTPALKPKSTPGPVKPEEATSVTSPSFTQPSATLFVNGLSPDDVQQGGVGDCTFQASMASIARSPEGRAYLKGLIHENYGKDGKVESYTVKLYKEVSPGKWEPRSVDVPANTFFSDGARSKANDKGEVEVWPRVLESAMLKLNGGVPTGNMPTSLATLTGTPALDTNVATPGIEQKMIDDFRLGRVQTLSTTGVLTKPIDDPKLFDAHCYTVTDIKQVVENGRVETLIYLRNPHGVDDPRPIKASELPKYFGDYSVGAMPKPD